MKHATGERDGSAFRAEAERQRTLPDHARVIEPVLDILHTSNYELPLEEAKEVWTNRVTKEPTDPALFVQKPCAVRGCSLLGTTDVSQYWSEEFTRGGLSLAAHYDPMLFDHDAGMQFCDIHVREYVFPLIDAKHGVTESQILADFKHHDLWR